MKLPFILVGIILWIIAERTVVYPVLFTFLPFAGGIGLLVLSFLLFCCYWKYIYVPLLYKYKPTAFAGCKKVLF